MANTVKAGPSARIIGDISERSSVSWSKFLSRYEGQPEKPRSHSTGIHVQLWQRATAAYVYLTGTLNAAIWGAELALGEGPGRIYVVEATGPVEDDPNLTDKKYPGNPTLSYRSKEPLRVIGEVIEWQGHSAEELKKMKDGVEQARQLGLEAI